METSIHREKKEEGKNKSQGSAFCLHLAPVIKTPEKYGLVSVCCSYDSAVQKACDGKIETGV